VNVDYHAHSNYSDGSFMGSMAAAAAEAGLDALGFTDHCSVSERPYPKRHRHAFGFNLDITHERRREGLETVREWADVRLLDGVEMDYHPADEAEIAAFLDDAGFAYTIGSVHELDGTNVHYEGHFAEQSASARRDHVATYFDRLVALVESELFDVAAHIDLVERNPALRGLATDAQYQRVAEALADSRTVPEINAGRVLDEYGSVHPTDPLLETLDEHGVAFVLGSDAHEPEELAPRHAALGELVAETGVETTELPV
jgi:histidinol-phosphatase (PHP family)